MPSASLSDGFRTYTPDAARRAFWGVNPYFLVAIPPSFQIRMLRIPHLRHLKYAVKFVWGVVGISIITRSPDKPGKSLAYRPRRCVSAVNMELVDRGRQGATHPPGIRAICPTASGARRAENKGGCDRRAEKRATGREPRPTRTETDGAVACADIKAHGPNSRQIMTHRARWQVLFAMWARYYARKMAPIMGQSD